MRLVMGGGGRRVASRNALPLPGSRRAYRLKMRKRNARREGLGGSGGSGVVGVGDLGVDVKRACVRPFLALRMRRRMSNSLFERLR
jgi:hypothetical protein